MKRSLLCKSILKGLDTIVTARYHGYKVIGGTKDDIINNNDDINRIFVIHYKDVWLGTLYMDQPMLDKQFSQNDHITLDMRDICVIYDVHQSIIHQTIIHKLKQ